MLHCLLNMKILLVLSVIISVAVQEKKNPITTNPEKNEKGEILWEGDMILNAEQLNMMYRSRTTRKAIIGSKFRWPNGVVSYIIHETSQPDREVILEALEHWANNTCLRFKEVNAGYQKPRIIFKKLVGCYSKIGMINKTYGQDISIGPGCAKVEKIAHEVGHAIGFWHEQSRPDRDEYVMIIEDNIREGKFTNFNKSHYLNTHGIPYDVSSIMHYHPTELSKNGKPTIVPKDVMQTFKMQNKKLSFFDLKLANLIYNCNGVCRTKRICQNQGYVDKTCLCRCPEGFKGNRCQISVEVPVACGGRYRNPLNITSPNYPENYPAGTRCIWSFEAPSGKKVKAYFADFHVLHREPNRNSCYWDYLEVRLDGGYEGNKSCDTELKHKNLTSEGNKMDLLFKGDYNYTIGFNIEVTFE